MLETTNLKLKKLQLSDAADITAINSNWDSLDEEVSALTTEKTNTITHRGNDEIHTTAAEKSAWNGKAAGNHNHDLSYAPVTHSNNGDIHVTAAQKTAWTGKAEGSHTHSADNINGGILAVARGGTGQSSVQALRNSMGLGNTVGVLPLVNGGTGAGDAATARSNLGAAPSGFGTGQHLIGNMINNPLDLSLKTGIYGYSTYAGGINSPLANMLGHVEIYALSNVWHYVVAVDHDSGLTYCNRYDENDGAWAGWVQLSNGYYITAPWINSSGGIPVEVSITLPFSPNNVFCDTTVVTGAVTGQNKSVIFHQGEDFRYLVQTSTGYIMATLSGKVVRVQYKTTEGFGFKVVAL